MSIESAFWVRQKISRDIFHLFIYLNLGLLINVPVEVSSTELNRCGKGDCMLTLTLSLSTLLGTPLLYNQCGGIAMHKITQIRFKALVNVHKIRMRNARHARQSLVFK